MVTLQIPNAINIMTRYCVTHAYIYLSSAKLSFDRTQRDPREIHLSLAANAKGDKICRPVSIPNDAVSSLCELDTHIITVHEVAFPS